VESQACALPLDAQVSGLTLDGTPIKALAYLSETTAGYMDKCGVTGFALADGRTLILTGTQPAKKE